MAEKMQWTSSVQVLGGPKIAAARAVEVSAYDKIQVVIPGDGEGVSVDVQPSANDRLRLLAITADRYATGEADSFSYVVEQEGEDPPAVTLDAPHLFVGSGALNLLGESVRTLVFTNNLGEDQAATVTILVGRQATEP